jgi:protein-disulfide isomerase
VVAPEPTQADHSQAKVPVNKDDLVVGPWNAPVTLVAFIDLECPFCGRVEATLEQLRATYGNDLRVVYKHNPLPFHQHAYKAALAAVTVRALAGNDLGLKYLTLVLTRQRELRDENLETWATGLGVSSVVYREAMESRRFARKVDADIELAKALGATGTPAFRVNGITLVGAQPYEKFAAAINQQQQEARRLANSGTPADRLYPTLCQQNFETPPAAVEVTPPPPDLTVWKVPVFADDPVLGAANAKVTVVVFSEFECPFCAKVEATLKQLRDKYGDSLRFVWKDRPLPFHKHATRAATLGRLVYQRKGNVAFWQLHDALFAQQKELDAAIAKEAERYGIAAATLDQAMKAGDAAKVIARSAETADDFGSRGTPSFFINGVRLQGAQPVEVFSERIDAAIATADALLAKGVAPQNLYKKLTETGKEPPPPETREVPLPKRSAPSRGPKNAKVTLQLFSDFQCPYCKRLEPTLDELQKEFPSQLRIVWRHFPLPFHTNAPLAAEAAEAAYAQKGADAFWKFHDRLLLAQSEAGGLERRNLETIAKELGLNLAAFNQALDDRTYRGIVEADADAAKAAQIFGTPAAVVGNYFISGAQPLAAFRRVVQRALSDAKAPKAKP